MPVSFARDVAPCFSEGDISCMAGFGVLLTEYEYLSNPEGDGTFADHANARNVYDRLTGTATPRMPMGGPYWSAAQLQLFEQWMADGFLA